MRLEGSCHCGAVRFTLDAPNPVPFMRCYCSICRKTAGTGGYAINLGGRADSLSVEGEDQISVYRAKLRGEDGSVTESSAERRFCRACGSALWLWDPDWPELIHPHAGAIDTPLPQPPERTHILLGSAPEWAQPDIREADRAHQGGPDESLADWHARTGLGD